MTTRRTFVKSAVAAGAALALGRDRAAAHEPYVEKAPESLRILILGGTGFTGPHQVRYAIARGHKVTVFNRGMRSAELPEGVQYLRGDRNAPNGVAALKNSGPWDVVIDVPTTLPKWVRDAGEALKGRADHFVFVSTISVYADFAVPGMNEDAKLAEYTGEKDPFALAPQEAGNYYGALKALSEREAEKDWPGRTAIIRPGLIVGEGDTSDRFTYWPVRIAKGGEVLVPGTGADPVQIIDARDLAEFIVRMAEQRATGAYNATGPRSALTMSEMIAGIRGALPGSLDVKFTYVPADFLAQHQIRGWAGPNSLPVWVPPREGNDGWNRISIQRAIDKGLTFRSLADTTQSVLNWYPKWFATLSPERQQRPAAGITAEKEKEVLAAWRTRA